MAVHLIFLLKPLRSIPSFSEEMFKSFRRPMELYCIFSPTSLPYTLPVCLVLKVALQFTIFLIMLSIFLSQSICICYFFCQEYCFCRYLPDLLPQDCTQISHYQKGLLTTPYVKQHFSFLLVLCFPLNQDKLAYVAIAKNSIQQGFVSHWQYPSISSHLGGLLHTIFSSRIWLIVWPVS